MNKTDELFEKYDAAITDEEYENTSPQDLCKKSYNAGYDAGYNRALQDAKNVLNISRRLTYTTIAYRLAELKKK